MDDKILAPVVRQLEEAVLREAKAIMLTQNSGLRTGGFMFNAEYKAPIKKEIERSFYDSVALGVSEMVKKELEDHQLKYRVQAVVRQLVGDEVKKQVEEKVAVVLKGMK